MQYSDEVEWMSWNRQPEKLCNGRRFEIFQRFVADIETNTILALQYFWKKAMAEINYQINFNEDQDMETHSILLSSDESEIDSPCSSPSPQLPNNVPDT